MANRVHLLGRRFGAAILILSGIGACSSSGGGGHTLMSTNTPTPATGGQMTAVTGGSGGTSAAMGTSGSTTMTTGGTPSGGSVSTGGEMTAGGTMALGGTSPGGTSPGGSATGGVASGGDTSMGGASGGAGGMAAANPGFAGPFDCTLVAGLLVTGEWYNAGFENDGVDGNKWEGIFVHYGYIDIWAQDPPGGFTWEGTLSSPCTTKSDAPDRLIFTAWSWELAYMTDVYVMQTAGAIRKFLQHYPSLKRIDLETIVRCPKGTDPVTMVSGQMCNPNAAIPPIAGTTDHNAGQQDCYVNPEVDQALDQVAAMPEFAGLVYVGPKFYSPACRMPVDGAHLGNNNTAVAQDIANYYNDGAP